MAPAVLEHFQALGPDALRSRFGAVLSADSLRQYVGRIRWDRHEALGLWDEPGTTLVGFAHVVRTGETHTAELGLSVRPSHQRQGLGRALLIASARHAGELGFSWVSMQCLRDNPAIMRWVLAAGFQVRTHGHEAFVTFPTIAPGMASPWDLKVPALAA